MRTKKLDTWLPVFSGFYNTFFDNSDYLLESNCQDEDDFKEYYSELVTAGISYKYFLDNVHDYINYSEYYKECAEYICHSLIDLDHAGIIKDVTFQKLVSPKYYNFSNDSINCEIEYYPAKLNKYLKANIEAFTAHIKATYTSRDGFHSSYPNDVDYWMDAKNYGEHELGSILNFIMFNQSDDAEMELLENSNLHEVQFNIDFNSMILDFNNKNKAV